MVVLGKPITLYNAQTILAITTRDQCLASPALNVDSGGQYTQVGYSRKDYIDLDQLAAIYPIVSNALHVIQNQIDAMNANRNGSEQVNVTN